MKNVHVISSDIDGAELRRNKVYNKYFDRCYGKGDEQEINEAIEFSRTSAQYGIPREAYERIFGQKL